MAGKRFSCVTSVLTDHFQTETLSPPQIMGLNKLRSMFADAMVLFD